MLRNEWLAHLDGLVVFRGLLAAEPLRSLHAALAAMRTPDGRCRRV